jgi:general stress protein 26
MRQTEAEKLKELLDSFETAVLITHSGGKLCARPMVIARVEENCDVWFITAKSSAKVHEIEADTRVQIVAQNGSRACVSISGHAKRVEDAWKVAELWREGFRPWFPGGKNDPDICLIFVRGEEAEYWNAGGTQGIRYLFRVARAYAAGERPSIEEGEEHGKVKLAVV